jgi:hypothetical protein
MQTIMPTKTIASIVAKILCLALTTLGLNACITTNDPYNQPYSSGYTGYTVGMGPSYWGSGYTPNPGYDYVYGNTGVVNYGGTGYYRSGYYGQFNGQPWYANPVQSIRANLNQ